MFLSNTNFLDDLSFFEMPPECYIFSLFQGHNKDLAYDTVKE